MAWLVLFIDALGGWLRRFLGRGRERLQGRAQRLRLWYIHLGRCIGPMWPVLVCSLLIVFVFYLDQVSDVLGELAESPDIEVGLLGWLPVASFLGALWSLQFVLWYLGSAAFVTVRHARVHERVEERRKRWSRRPFRRPRLARWLPWIAGVLPGLAAALFYLEEFWPEGGRGALALAGACAAPTALVLLRTRRRCPVLPIERMGDPLGWLTILLAFGLVFALALLIPTDVFRVRLPQALGTATIILFGAGYWTAVVTACFVLPTRVYRLPPLILAPLLLAVTFGLLGLSDNHRLVVLPGTEKRTEARSTPTKYLEDWLAHRSTGAADTARPQPLIIVAAEGGGIRAAYWTAGILSRLADCNPRFAKSIFAISAVSGGSLGAAVFAGLLAEKKEATPFSCEAGEMGALQSRAAQILRQDFLAPTVAGLLFADVPQRVLPKSVFPDRQHYLEQAWRTAWNDRGGDGSGGLGNDRFGRGFLELWLSDSVTLPARLFSALPALLFNVTVVETGRRSIFSNLAIDDNQFLDATDGFKLLSNDISLATAVGLSSRFTYVSPAATVPLVVNSRPLTRLLVDGGYFENSAALTAMELKRVLRNSCEIIDELEWRCGPQKRRVWPVLLLLRNATIDAAEPGSGSAFIRAFGELAPPAQALMQTRVARGEHAARTAKLESRTISLDLPNWGYAQGKPRCKEHWRAVPLGWTLAPRTADYLDCEIEVAQNQGAEAISAPSRQQH